MVLLEMRPCSMRCSCFQGNWLCTGELHSKNFTNWSREIWVSRSHFQNVWLFQLVHCLGGYVYTCKPNWECVVVRLRTLQDLSTVVLALRRGGWSSRFELHPPPPPAPQGCPGEPIFFTWDGLPLYACFTGSSCSWYYSNLSRAEAEGLLRENGNEGCFLVRDSSQKGKFTLSVFTREV